MEEEKWKIFKPLLEPETMEKQKVSELLASFSENWPISMVKPRQGGNRLLGQTKPGKESVQPASRPYFKSNGKTN